MAVKTRQGAIGQDVVVRRSWQCMPCRGRLMVCPGGHGRLDVLRSGWSPFEWRSWRCEVRWVGVG